MAGFGKRRTPSVRHRHDRLRNRRYGDRTRADFSRIRYRPRSRRRNIVGRHAAPRQRRFDRQGVGDRAATGILAVRDTPGRPGLEPNRRALSSGSGLRTRLTRLLHEGGSRFVRPLPPGVEERKIKPQHDGAIVDGRHDASVAFELRTVAQHLGVEKGVQGTAAV